MKIKLQSGNTTFEFEGDRNEFEEMFADSGMVQCLLSISEPLIVPDQKAVKEGSESLSLGDFYWGVKPKTYYEKNLSIAYYLRNIQKKPDVGHDDILRAYRALGEKAPTAFNQSIYETATEKKWFMDTERNSVTLTISGENWVIERLKDVQ